MTQEELDKGRERKPRNTTDRRPTMSELKAYRFVLATESSNLGGVVYTSKYVYAQDDVDKLLAKKDKEIAKLKDKCQMHDFFWEGCGFDKLGFKNSIAVREAFDRLEAENEKLRGESCKLTDGCLRLKQCRKEKANIADELRHSNYKRCLAMARWCERKRIDAATFRTPREKWDFYDKWYKRWLALAVEPTWAKFLQLIHKEAK